jgi:hypothetical protein
MPSIAPDEMSRHPKLLVPFGLTYSLGWQSGRKAGRSFVVMRLGAWSDKVVQCFPLTEEGWGQAWASLVSLDPDAAKSVARAVESRATSDAGNKAEIGRQARVYDAFVRAGQSRAIFRVLGVQVLPGTQEVYSVGTHDPSAKTNTSRLLGPLAGAEALVTDGSQAWSPGRAMLMPVALTAIATKTVAHAAVVFVDGSVHTAQLNGNSVVRNAQLEVVQFNALAGATESRAAESPANDPAAKLTTLKDLLDAGLISQAEYDAKRAEVIKSI